MTNIKNLEIVKAILLEKKAELTKQIASHQDAFKEEKKVLWEAMFATELASLPSVQIVIGYSGLQFVVDGREIGSLTTRGWGGYREDEFYFNTYSTFIEDEFEYKRLIFNGKVAEKILYHQESVQALFKTKYSKSEESDKLVQELTAIEREIRDKEFDIIEARKQEVTYKLYGEGMEFDDTKLFELARNFRNYGVKKVRVIDATKSGKTVNLEATYGRYDWDSEGKRIEIGEKVVIHEKVKMDCLIGNFSDYICS